MAMESPRGGRGSAAQGPMSLGIECGSLMYVDLQMLRLTLSLSCKPLNAIEAPAAGSYLSDKACDGLSAGDDSAAPVGHYAASALGSVARLRSRPALEDKSTVSDGHSTRCHTIRKRPSRP